MKVKEVIERECCEQEDIVRIGNNNYKCKHCNSEYVKETFCDAAGDTDTRLKLIKNIMDK